MLVFKRVVWAFVLLIAPAAIASPGFEGCQDQFPQASLNNAPTRTGARPGEPSKGNLQLCQHSGKTSFFAIEYNPKRLAPDWVAYRVEDHFGPHKCSSRPRNEMQCYFKKDDAEGCIEEGNANKKWPGDPFHSDSYLSAEQVPYLTPNAFSGTGHDRGHMAPNNAFSWHMCGTYKTFTMANMSAQLAYFNRHVWQQLEEAVLYWGVTKGPIFEVTGPIYQPFPSEDVGPYNKKLAVKVGALLRPDGTGPRVIRPTGYYKVLYRPGHGSGDPDRAIAFLLPHTSEKNLDFTNFAVPVSLVEQTSGYRFGFATALKEDIAADYWVQDLPPGNWSVRPAANDFDEQCPTGYTAPGWFSHLSAKARVKLCESDDYHAPQ